MIHGRTVKWTTSAWYTLKMTGKRDKSLLSFWIRTSVALIVFIVAYVLSYAPVYRVCGFGPVSRGGRLVGYAPDHVPFYRPVEWLMDNTPLSGPLYKWGGVWGCEYGLHLSAHGRRR